MKKLADVVLVTALAVVVLSVLILARTSGPRTFRGTVIRADQTDRIADNTQMLDEATIAHIQVIAHYFDNMYGDWKQIHDGFQDLLDITDQQQLQTDMAKLNQKVIEFDQRAEQMHVMYQAMMSGHDSPGDVPDDTRQNSTGDIASKNGSVLR